jgi:dihydrofolate synthase/folylpolyglutamate synthase
VSNQSFDAWFGRELGNDRLANVTLGLPGEAQSSNAALALMTALLLRDRFGRLSEAGIRQGLRDARWPGRLELHNGRPSVLLDVAHTPASARQLRRYLDRFFPKTPKTLVLGLLRDKNASALAEELASAFDSVIVAPVKWFRSMEPEVLQQAFLAYRDQVDIAPTVSTGVELGMQSTPADGLVVVAGSVFAVGEVKRRFRWV